jgi:hypothetical protein
VLSKSYRADREEKKFDPVGSIDLAMVVCRTFTGSVNNHDSGHPGHDRSGDEIIPSSDLKIATNPNPA